MTDEDEVYENEEEEEMKMVDFAGIHADLVEWERRQKEQEDHRKSIQPASPRDSIANSFINERWGCDQPRLVS